MVLQVDWLYYVAFLVVVIGLVIYSTTYVLDHLLENMFFVMKIEGF